MIQKAWDDIEAAYDLIREERELNGALPVPEEVLDLLNSAQRILETLGASNGEDYVMEEDDPLVQKKFDTCQTCNGEGFDGTPYMNPCQTCDGSGRILRERKTR